ncbi:amino acid transporter AVT1F-like [Patiria miniata]|uniref:Amino acid transporter transmembrane domain-containing protein n=1 Tax=Patiria miniata TaxID=46514 RepID=A0A914B5P3_PATMI|nr:amino acid transporter AVT1F-like [Patiria miniata]
MKQRNTEKIELLSAELPPDAAGRRAGDSAADDGQQLPVHRKLGVPIVVFMIIGKVVGGGLIWFPKALSEAGWFGFIVMLIAMATSTFTGVLLARSWLVLMNWFPAKYRDEINRFPYPSIGYETFGDVGRRVTAVLIGLYSFGFSVALYLVAADSLSLFFRLLDVRISLCVWIPVIIAGSAPLLWFGTPKDMVAVGIAMGSTTVLGTLALITGSILDIGEYPDPGPVTPTFASVAGAMGLVMSAFGGQFVIPTLQHDMKSPADMQLSAALGYLGIGTTYVAIGLPTFLIYGNIYEIHGADNVLALLTTKPIQVIIIIMLSSHLIAACVFMNNPTFQDLENYLNIPYDISWKRILLRSAYSALMLFVAASVPSFPVYLSVVGGALAATVNGILPSVLYLKLCSLEPPDGAEPEGPLRWHQTLVICIVITVSLFAAFTSSISGVYNILQNTHNVTLPCYISH